MRFPVPYESFFDASRNVVRLYFEDNEIIDSGEYFVRGGICWPVVTETGISGHISICGRNVETGITYVFDDRSFVSADNILESNGDGILHRGILTWLRVKWAKYCGIKYYWNQAESTNRKYMLAVSRSFIEPKPEFVRVTWQDSHQALFSVMYADTTGMLRYSRESRVLADMEIMNGDSEYPVEKLPALYSLMCCMYGFEINKPRVFENSLDNFESGNFDPLHEKLINSRR